MKALLWPPYLIFYICIIDSLRRSTAQTNVKISSSSSRAHEMLEKRYNLTHARKGKQAVKEAINFLLGQEKYGDNASTNKSLSSITSNKQRKKCVSKENCPVCIVSMNSIINEGRFEYRGDDAGPPYPAKCWSQSVRYHVAPECEKEEIARGVVPVYKWRWTLTSAEEGYCKMPDASPPAAASQYFNRFSKGQRNNNESSNSNSNAPPSISNKEDKTASKKTLNVVFVGLSFMSQPWQSLGCLYSDLVVGGLVSGSDNEMLSVMDVKKDGGVCSAYKREKIIDYHPIALHPNYSLPVQHSKECSADHAHAIYQSPDPGLSKAKVCFIYTFNVLKNVKPGHKLPW